MMRTMIEVYAGTRPGNRRRLILLLSLFLVGTLGLAWSQVLQSRQLAEEIAIPGTPLRFRPPAGWQPDSRDPGRFLAPTAGPAAEDPIRRSIRVSYERRPAFIPLELLIADWNSTDRAESTSPRPADRPLAGLDAAQVVRRRAVRFRNRMMGRETVLRAAVSGRGDVIRIEYAPAATFTPGDGELLEAICATVRLDDPAFRPTRQLLDAIGVRLPLLDDWRVCGADFEGAPAVYAVEPEGLPHFAVGVARTWLRPGATHESLLRGFAEQIWELALDPPPIAEIGRPDGARVLRMRHPQMTRGDHLYRSVRLVAQSDGQLALLVAISPAAEAAEVDAICEQLAAQMTLIKTSALPDPAEAAQAAVRRLAQLREAGLETVFGNSRRRSYYMGTFGWRQLVAAFESLPGGRSGAAWQGRTLEIFTDGGESEAGVWALDARGEAYAMRVDAANNGARFSASEERGPETPSISRTLRRGARERQDSFAVGANFVPPPLEIAAAGLAAEGDEWLLFEFSRSRGVGSLGVLCRAQRSDPDGHRRVLRLNDYWPQGRIAAYDPRGELVYEELPGGRLRRIDERSALQAAPFLREFLRERFD